MAAVLPSQALLPRFTVSRHPRRLLIIIRTVRSRSNAPGCFRGCRSHCESYEVARNDGPLLEKGADRSRRRFCDASISLKTETVQERNLSPRPANGRI